MTRKLLITTLLFSIVCGMFAKKGNWTTITNQALTLIAIMFNPCYIYEN